MPPESTPIPATGRTPSVSLQINGEPRRVPAPCSITQLLRLLGIEGRRVAVAVDREVVPRSAFARHRLAEGDRVEILEAVGGG